MQEGDIGEEAYVILQGSVLITKKNEHDNVLILRTCEAGDIVGEMALISEEPRSATVRALEDTTVAVLTRQVIAQHLKKLPPYMEQIVATLTHRLQTLSTLIHPHLATDSTWVVLKQLRLLAIEQSNGHAEQAMLPFQGTLEEISEDLGIPLHVVEDVVFMARDQKILVCTHETIHIHDMQELLGYARQHKHINKANQLPAM
jgi:CRP/FNR family cyclic AMP-dependent transcriptional regulator